VAENDCFQTSTIKEQQEAGSWHRNQAMNKPETVLSFSTDPQALLRRECALRREGFQVHSVTSEIQARFEIEMGRCGVLLMCFRATEAVVQDLSTLFRRSCPTGTIIFVMNSSGGSAPKGVDYVVPESVEAEAIVQTLRSSGGPASQQRSSAAD
jgi:hypothetical protein